MTKRLILVLSVLLVLPACRDAPTGGTDPGTARVWLDLGPDAVSVLVTAPGADTLVAGAGSHQVLHSPESGAWVIRDPEGLPPHLPILVPGAGSVVLHQVVGNAGQLRLPGISYPVP